VSKQTQDKSDDIYCVMPRARQGKGIEVEIEVEVVVEVKEWCYYWREVVV